MSNRNRRNKEKSKKRNYIKYNYKYKTKKPKDRNKYRIKKEQYQDLNDAKEKFLMKIIPYFRLKNQLQYWQAPNKNMLLRRGFNELLIFLEKNHINYRKFVFDVNLEIFKSKWSGLNKERAVVILKGILTHSLRSNLNLKLNEGPSKKQLEDPKIGYGDFIYAIYNHEMFLSEIIDNAGLNPHPKDAAQEAGINAHWVLEKIFLQCTRGYNLQSYYEIYPSILHHKKKSDNAILRNQEFKEKIEEKQSVLNIPNSIELLNVEYYSGSDLETIIQKCQKDYQGERKFLIIVSLSTQRKKIKTPNVPYKEHVKVLNKNEFADFMGYKGKELLDYIECIELTQKAPWNLDARKKLRQMKKEAKKLLEQKYNYRQESLETDLGEEKAQLLLQGTILSQKDKSKENSKEEIKEEKEKEEIIESSAGKDFNSLINESREQHPFDSRFNELEEDNVYNNQFVWFSPQVRENIEKNKERLLEKAKEQIVRKIDSLDSHEVETDSKKNDQFSEKNSSSNNIFEKQPLINPEIGPKEVIPHQEGEGTNLIPIQNSEMSKGKILEQMIENIPEVPIEEPPEVEPPEVPIAEPPEPPKPPEEPPEAPPEEPPEMPPELPPTSVVGVGVPSEVGVSIIANIEVPQFADYSSGLESQTQEYNFDDDFENFGDDYTDKENNFNDDIEDFDEPNDEFLDENEEGINELTDDQEEVNDPCNNQDDPINCMNLGEYAPEAEAYSSYGYSDCPDDYPGE